MNPGPIPEGADDPVEHLWNAAHEFLKAMRALVDAADEFVEQQRQPREAQGPRVQHIDIDVPNAERIYGGEPQPS